MLPIPIKVNLRLGMFKLSERDLNSVHNYFKLSFLTVALLETKHCAGLLGVLMECWFGSALALPELMDSLNASKSR